MLVISLPNYRVDFLLYLVAFDSTIGMVLIQTDVDCVEHVIYYLSQGLVGVELCYPYIEKLAMAVAFVVDHF